MTHRFKFSLATLAGLASLAPTVQADTFITVSPRIWNFYDNRATGFSDSDVIVIGNDSSVQELRTRTANQVNINLFGGSLSVRNSVYSNWQFTATGLYGEDTNTTGSTTIDRSGGTNLLTVTQETNNINRLDTEFLLQRRFENRPEFSIIGGISYSQSDIDSDGFFETTEITAANDVIETNGVADYELTVREFGLRLGGGAIASVADNQLVYANAMVVLQQDSIGDVTGNSGPSSARFRSGGGQVYSVGPDISVGYSYAFSSKVSAIVRYRLKANFPFEATGSSLSPSFNDPRVQHGFNVTLSYRFGA